MVLFCFFDSPFTMNSHPNLPQFLRKAAQICLCIDIFGAKKTVETFSEWPHRAHRRMTMPPRVPMGSVVNGHAPAAYRDWWLNTYTHLSERKPTELGRPSLVVKRSDKRPSGPGFESLRLDFWAIPGRPPALSRRLDCTFGLFSLGSVPTAASGSHILVWCFQAPRPSP